MENQFYLNPGIPPVPSPLSMPPDWQTTFSSAMEIQSQNCFLGLQYDSGLSSMVSSPAAASNCNISGESLMIRELIGKLGSIGSNSDEISPHSQPLMASYMNSNSSLNSSVAEFAADPGFAERAAKFSCFGSRSFNGRTTTTQFEPNHNTEIAGFRSNPLPPNSKLPRVSSTPAIKPMAVSSSSQEESTISEQNPKASNPRKRKATPKPKSKETSPSPSPNASKVSEVPSEASNEKRCKLSENNGSAKPEEDDAKVPEPPKDYIHVRARRGQATDSHSLAERVRREKISERMKLLQNLVPGCNKVTGKALMLDEIINYVQSLQRQVEFLSMKLSSVNTRLDFNVESLMSKDVFQSNNSLQHPIYPINSAALHGNISNGTITQCSSVDPLDTPICPKFNPFTETVPQYPTFCEGDLETLVQMGLHSQDFHGSNQVSDMKMEL